MSIYVDLQEMCRWFFQFMFLFVHCLKVTCATRSYVLLWAKCKRYYVYMPEEIQSSCQKLLHVDFHLTRRENRSHREGRKLPETELNL
jgi:hypothetical protein